MTNTPRPPLADAPAGAVARGRGDTVLYALAIVTLVLIAVQFALAGFGAFTMDKTPTDNVYGPHAVVGLLIAAMTVLILVAVLASRAARAHRRTLWLAVSLAALSVAVEPALGSGGTTIPVLGALHALNGLAILALTGRLTWETNQRRRTNAADGARKPRSADTPR
jgi:cytochrome b561